MRKVGLENITGKINGKRRIGRPRETKSRTVGLDGLIKNQRLN